VEAIEQDDDGAQAGELGDLIFLLLMVARIGRERGAYDLEEVCQRVVAKMRFRHPGILRLAQGGEEPFDGAPESWEASKARERSLQGGGCQSILDGIPASLPALIRTHRAGEKVSRVGFDWPDVAGVRAKVDEELGELDRALARQDPEAIRHELGDLLMTAANLSRLLGVGPEEALREANSRFDMRFRALEGLAISRELDIHEAALEQLEALWQEVKAGLGSDGE